MNLWTFGYAKLGDSGGLARRLAPYGVERVVDIRYRRASWTPAWGRMTEATVRAAGFDYAWLQGLGNVNYKGGPIQLANPEDVQLLVHLADQQRTAIMCACLDVEKCHRLTVADLLARAVPGLVIEHIGA